MKLGRIFAVVLLVLLTLAGYFIYTLKTRTVRFEQVNTTTTLAGCTPTFKDGGGPYYKPNSPFRLKIAPDTSKGDQLIVSGKMLKNDCITPIGNAVLDIWQANETGNYEDEWYRGQVISDAEGNYTFESVVPKGYGEGTGYRPPHIHFKVFIEGSEMITSQMFFPEVKGTPGFDDAYIMKIERSVREGVSINLATHDIILP